jgi:hypothetical protein
MALVVKRLLKKMKQKQIKKIVSPLPACLIKSKKISNNFKSFHLLHHHHHHHLLHFHLHLHLHLHHLQQEQQQQQYDSSMTAVCQQYDNNNNKVVKKDGFN